MLEFQRFRKSDSLCAKKISKKLKFFYFLCNLFAF